jgi:guanine deaminase
MAKPTGKPSLFLGSFIHSKKLDELEYFHKTAIFVDSKGVIVHIEKDCDQARAEEAFIPRLGWRLEEVAVRIAQDGQFFFPGFIGMIISSLSAG